MIQDYFKLATDIVRKQAEIRERDAVYKKLTACWPQIEQAFHLYDYEAFKTAILIAYHAGKAAGFQETLNDVIRKMGEK